MSSLCEQCGQLTDREAMVVSGFRRAALCVTCRDLLDAVIDAEDQARESARMVERTRGRLSASGLPAALQAVCLGQLGDGEAVRAAQEWAAVPCGRGLLLTGDFGVGKTTIAAAAMTRAACLTAVRWVNAPLLLARLGLGHSDEQRRLASSALLGRECLVLDDIDKVRPTEYGAEQLFVAIDSCITGRRGLLVTTNLGLGELAARYPGAYGEAIASRLAGACRAVRVTGPDRRLAGGGEL